MKINGKEYQYRIEPHYGKVVAEIFKILVNETFILYKKHNWKNLNPSEKIAIERGSITEIHLCKKSFGRWWRKPIDKDYIEAKEWAESHLDSIHIANETNLTLQKK